MSTHTLKKDIFAVGTWNGVKVDKAMLEEIAENFTLLGDKLKVALKIGHNDEQPLTDGQPALGWVSKVWVKKDKLWAEFTDIPDIVYRAIKKRLYDNVSIEASFDVEYRGKNIGTTMTAVAILGADIPAVSTLDSLSAFMSAKKGELKFSEFTLFTKKEPKTMPKDNDELTKLVDRLTNLETKFSKSETDNALLKKENAELKASAATAKFAADKTQLTTQMEQMVKDGQMTPAARDKVLKDLTEETIGQAKATVEVFSANPKTGRKTGEEGRKDDGDDGGDKEVAPDILVARKARVFAAKHSVSFSAAVESVLHDDPELAKRYRDQIDDE